MKIIVEYKIISGNVIETRRSFMTVRSPGEPKPRRAPRLAGNSSERKIKANEQETVKRLARTINTNFRAGNCLLTLKYDDEHLPGTYEAAEAYIKKVLDKARKKFKKLYGRNPKVVWVTANWSTKHQCPARLHHHLVVEDGLEKIITELWETCQGIILTYLDNRLDHSDLAAYLLNNVHGKPGKERYHSTRNMVKPFITEPVPVDDVENVQPEKGAVIKEHSNTTDEDGRVISAYLRCTVPVAPKVRGGKLVMPRPKKRGGKKLE